MDIISLDKNLFLFVNSFVGKVPFFDNVVKLLVNEYFVPVSLALVIVYIWFVSSKNQIALPVAFYSLIVVDLIIHVSNIFIVRQRPFGELPANLLFYKPTDPSFPSNAAAVGFALAFSIWSVNRKFGIFALILATFYAFSRVYAGVHFPLDVVVGSLLGILVALVVSKFATLIRATTDFARKVQAQLRLNLD